MNKIPSDIECVLIDESQIESRVRALANQISKDYKDAGQLYVLGILKGAFIFMADLTRRLSVRHVVDFMALSSYGKSSQSGAVRILMDLRQPIENKHVLVVEDIVDTGQTLNYLHRILRGRNPASLRTCVLVQKEGKEQKVEVDYLGFVIPDVWVVGYGLDYAEQYRTLPYIAELKEEVYRT